MRKTARGSGGSVRSLRLSVSPDERHHHIRRKAQLRWDRPAPQLSARAAAGQPRKQGSNGKTGTTRRDPTHDADVQRGKHPREGQRVRSQRKEGRGPAQHSGRCGEGWRGKQPAAARLLRSHGPARAQPCVRQSNNTQHRCPTRSREPLERRAAAPEGALRVHAGQV